jgi:hypothetical protein
MEYSFTKTVTKAAPPILIVIILRTLAKAIEQYGIKMNEADIIALAVAGYGVVIGFKNWLKNRNKKAS